MAERKKIRLKVAAPCDASWAQMRGDDAERFCGTCEKTVYNLSHMTSEQIEALLESGKDTGGVCGRFYQRKDGTVLTQDCPTGLRRRRRRQKIIGASAALLATVGASGLAAQLGASSPPCESADETYECAEPVAEEPLPPEPLEPVEFAPPPSPPYEPPTPPDHELVQGNMAIDPEPHMGGVSLEGD